jgi:hypothetical protein
MAKGEFSGEPQALWITEDGTEDRTMRLIEDFWFRDPRGKKWEAHKDDEVDGASIPRALWTLVGSPYTGDYRRASIVHDRACVDAGSNAAKRRAADRMFYHACRTGGCSIWQATLLYIGVRVGATLPYVDAWQGAAATSPAGPRIRRTEAEDQLERDFQKIADRVLAGGEVDDPNELEKRMAAALFMVAGLKVPATAKRRPRRRKSA